MCSAIGAMKRATPAGNYIPTNLCTMRLEIDKATPAGKGNLV